MGEDIEIMIGKLKCTEIQLYRNKPIVAALEQQQYTIKNFIVSNNHLREKDKQQQAENSVLKTHVLLLKSDKTEILDLMEDANCLGDVAKILRQYGR